ncbi:MAG: hypothetical protein WBH31_11720 [Promethearchaeia archaeon]
MAVYDWIIGMGLMFGLAFTFNYMTFKDLKAFFGYLMIFNAFIVWAGILPVWSLVICVIISSTIIYINFQGV